MMHVSKRITEFLKVPHTNEEYLEEARVCSFMARSHCRNEKLFLHESLSIFSMLINYCTPTPMQFKDIVDGLVTNTKMNELVKKKMRVWLQNDESFTATMDAS